jgi:hypothetical protein
VVVRTDDGELETVRLSVGVVDSDGCVEALRLMVGLFDPTLDRLADTDTVEVLL